MTCRELLAIEHPACINNKYLGGVEGCPHDYGYLYRPESCVVRKLISSNRICTACWDREVPNDVLIEKRAEGVAIPDHAIVNEEPTKDSVVPEDVIAKFNEIPHGNIISTIIEEADTPEKPKILDSGNRREFESGAVRDIQEGKGRCDLLPLDVIYTFYRSYLEENYAVLWHIDEFIKTGDVSCLYNVLVAQDIFTCIETMILEVAKHFEEGCKKYGERNWEKGIPIRCYIDSAVRHYLKYKRGDTDEPHDRAFIWNILCCIWTCKHKPELNEYAKKEEEK